MKNHSHVNGHVMKGVAELIGQIPPLNEYKNPYLAALSGGLGAIGIGLYFRTKRDFLWSFGICATILIVAAPTGEALAVLAPIICGFYGYHRAKSSNARLAARWTSGPIIDVEAVSDSTRPPAIPSRRPGAIPPPLPKQTKPTMFVVIDGEQRGPFTASQVAQMLRTGRIEKDALCWVSGMKDWRPLSEGVQF